MHKILTPLFFSFFFPQLLHAQLAPKEGSKLNYRIIGFKIPVAHHGKNYKIEIAHGNWISEDSFKNHITETYPVDEGNTICEVPSFGASYTWSYSYTVKGIGMGAPLYHFSTTKVRDVDTNVTRLRILEPAVKHQDCYVFMDRTRTLYDMNGKPVWYLPNVKEVDDYVDNWLSDLKVSSHNTITYILRPQSQRMTCNYQAYEVDYDGNILWKGPDNGAVSGDSIEHYNHELTRLDNGHYMVLGSEMTWKFPTASDSAVFLDTNKYSKEYHPVEFGTIIEYDEKGNVVWSWKSSKFFLEQDTDFVFPLKKYYTGVVIHGNLDVNYQHPNIYKLEQDVHENAFYFDEENKVIYVSFKNTSRILKVKYPEGIVLKSYGQTLKPGKLPKGKKYFDNQHSLRLSKNGYLYLFNNNLGDTAIPKIVMLQEPVGDKDSLKKIWEYQCTDEGGYKYRKYISGGNVMELPDGDLFVCMGSDYSKVFIVNMDKKILWSALPERWNASRRTWRPIHQYRASIMTREQLESMIWNSEKREESLVSQR